MKAATALTELDTRLAAMRSPQWPAATSASPSLGPDSGPFPGRTGAGMVLT